MTLWDFTPFDIFLYGLTAITTHLLMSLGQTLFHRYLGHHRLGGRFFIRHVKFHHAFYSGDHIISSNHPNNEGNNTPFFLIPTALVIGLSYFFLRLDLFFVQILAMSLSFGAHVYLDKQYHMAGSWLGRFSWFRKKQQLHLVHHLHANCNFAIIDYFWDRLFGSYLQPGTAHQGRGSRGSFRGKPRFITKVSHRERPLGEQPRPLAMPIK